MGVENNKVNETFVMNGVLTTFSVTNMRVVDRSHIKAYVIDNTDVDNPVTTTLVLDGGAPDGYTVTLVTPNSFDVDVQDARDANFELVVYREVPLTQESDYTDYGKFPAETVEDDFDLNILIDQQIDDKANRSLKFDIDIDLNTTSPVIPAPEADSVLGWKDDLSGLENKPDLAAQVAAAEAAQAAAEAAQAAAAASQAAAAASEAAAAASAAAASTSETNAAASAAAAATSETNAAASEAAAAASAAAALASENAAAAYATQLVGTSTTSVAIGLGSKGFTTQAGKFFDAGNFVLITSDADPTNYLHGQVTSYAGTALTVDVTDIGGAGTFADWTIRLSSVAGTDGANSNFTDLADTPASYAGASLYKVRVNAAETGLEFTPDTGGSGGGLAFSTLLMGG